ncbi:hypothetical protein [uncultured Pluralibacter sp.]|uniref:hypothetical protein n=1 Tax=uncultured Pluralibacter sp. TaxID=1490864 RepID=UPI002625CA0A|nr:hypothetical protein [uncultured Pluralibacter sp.]
MKKEITESELSEYGFTEKEVSRLSEILTRPENKNDTYFTLLNDLRKRFWGGIIGVVIAFIIAIFWFLNFEKNDFTYPIIILFLLIVIYKLTPFPMALKAYKFYLKNK